MTQAKQRDETTMATRPPYLRVVHSSPSPAGASRPDVTPWPPHWSTTTAGAQLRLIGAEPRRCEPAPEPEPEPVERPVLRLVRPEPAPAPTPRHSRVGVALVAMGSLITFGMAVAAAPLAAVPASAVIAAVIGLALWG